MENTVVGSSYVLHTRKRSIGTIASIGAQVHRWSLIEIVNVAEDGEYGLEFLGLYQDKKLPYLMELY